MSESADWRGSEIRFFLWMSYENGTSVAPLHQKVESEEELRKEREEDDRRASRTCAACAELCVKEAGCCVETQRESAEMGPRLRES